MNKNDTIIDDTFVEIKTLGVGFTSKVILAEHRDTGYKLAIKIFKPIRNYNILLDSFRKEVDSMKNLRHENLINIIAANESGVMVKGKVKENIMYLGVELAENAELFDFVADPGKQFSEDFARHFFKQLILGLKSMHDIKVAHRDLKTENLFLNNEFHLKIGDFGFSKFMNPDSHYGKLKTQLGTSGYQCPEMLEGQLYDGAANDIFACGVILFILTKAYPPFREAKKTDNWYRHIYYEKFDNFWTTHSKRGNSLSKELVELITGMLRYKNRLTIEDILKHEWLKGDVPSPEVFEKEMKERKKIVDARREKDAQEAMLLQKSGANNGQVYRGESEDLLVKKLVDEFESYNIGNYIQWDNHSARNLLRFNSSDVKSVFNNLIEILVYEKAEITLSTTHFSLEAKIDYTEKINDDEGKESDFTTICNFTAEAYIDYDQSCVFIELIKDRNTDAFIFKDLVDQLTNKYMK
jgi:serine/threonine protein kinase